ncbi:galactokinase [Zeaxanthinibacter sp. PT1]|uniref:galactokinase n=1 Tax=Zeaxanthinibacter TaxID=561554 RepID=UPI00234AF915|nr:galactokinase [Zeaxanthinibacter sp. PT1]MDC6351953.1 galactokinase [Zeaxanthinibacter sp. PT1]
MKPRSNKPIPDFFPSPEPGDLVVYAPGRINLIGEHIDYNGGHVLPAAIDQQLELVFRRNDTAQCRVYSERYDHYFEFCLDDLNPVDNAWRNYIIGITAQLKIKSSTTLNGFDCLIRGELPAGAGLSSSAALLCGTGKGLNSLYKLGLTDKKIILMAQKAEHDYAGTQCGVMDQFAVVKGKKSTLIHLDCQTLNYELVPANFKPYTLVLLNTNVSHKLADSEYNSRRNACEKALEIINDFGNHYRYLVDVPKSTLLDLQDSMPVDLYSKALFVIEENNRVLQAVDEIKGGRIEALGRLMFLSHSGLRDLYKVSCPELDFLVDYASNKPYIAGSRMMGGGFGGCTINLVHENHVNEFTGEISEAYLKSMKQQLTPLTIKLSQGITISEFKSTDI